MKHISFAVAQNDRWWKYLILFIASFLGGQTIGGIPLLIVIVFKTIQSGGTIIPNPENMSDLSVFGIDPNLGLFLMILPFVASLAILLLLYKPIHRRNYKTLITGAKSIRWNHFLIGAGVWLILNAAYLIIDYSANPGNYTFNFNFQSFIILVLISVMLIPFQASYEEILFRGYLAQGVAAWTKSKWMAIIIPSLLFGSMHILNPEIQEYGFWVTMPQYVLFGLIFGLVTVLDNGTELAMGAHSVNNVFLSIVITSKASVLQTPALLIQQNVNPLKDLIILSLIFALFVVILSSVYKWDYKGLFAKINPEVTD